MALHKNTSIENMAILANLLSSYSNKYHMDYALLLDQFSKKSMVC